ncbi:MAG: hypothetical protein COT85_03725 [Chlamydiae bacterium CG10_big_fil_rev_8_21_14_0_10_42_34]|nr:MAG: hypothetical protein COT85_03725 [Chlamydiae bacterium CG10_big_fil_rev_8_21_14_0_10_42_34]
MITIPKITFPLPHSVSNHSTTIDSTNTSVQKIFFNATGQELLNLLNSRALDKGVQIIVISNPSQTTNDALSKEEKIGLGLGEALTLATNQGRLEDVKEIVRCKNSHHISKEKLGEALTCSALKDHLKVVNTLLESDLRDKIPAKDLELALQQAIIHEYKGIVSSLLNSKVSDKISEEMLVNHYIWLVANKELGTAIKLLKSDQCDKIPARALEDSLILAADNGHIELIRVLSGLRPKIDARIVAALMITFAGKGQSNVTEALMNNFLKI